MTCAGRTTKEQEASCRETDSRGANTQMVHTSAAAATALGSWLMAPAS